MPQKLQRIYNSIICCTSFEGFSFLFGQNQQTKTDVSILGDRIRMPFQPRGRNWKPNAIADDDKDVALYKYFIELKADFLFLIGFLSHNEMNS